MTHKCPHNGHFFKKLENCSGTTCRDQCILLWSKSDLDLGRTRTDVSNGISTCDGEQLCSFILKFIHKCWSYGQVKNWSSSDLDLRTTWTNVSNGTSMCDGKQLFKFILKSIQNCRSYGPDKSLTFKCDLYLQPTWTNVSKGTSTSDGEQFRQIILKSIHNCRSYGPDIFRLTHAHTPNCHCENYVLLTPSWLHKNDTDIGPITIIKYVLLNPFPNDKF